MELTKPLRGLPAKWDIIERELSIDKIPNDLFKWGLIQKIYDLKGEVREEVIIRIWDKGSAFMGLETYSDYQYTKIESLKKESTWPEFKEFIKSILDSIKPRLKDNRGVALGPFGGGLRKNWTGD